MTEAARLVDELTTLLYEVTTGWDDSAGGHQVVRCGACRRRADRAESVVHDSDCPVYRLIRAEEANTAVIRANAEEIADLEDVRDGLEAQVNAMTAENERGQQAFADLTLASVERINALEAERDEWKRINQSDNQCAARRLEQAESERDALAARLAASEAALPDPGKLWSLATWLDSVYPYDSNPEVQTDLRTWAKAIVATGAHPGAWVREVVEDSAALAASSAEPSTVTTRTITIRCHCGRGVSVGADPWCEGCVQSAATCDCVPLLVSEVSDGE